MGRYNVRLTQGGRTLPARVTVMRWYGSKRRTGSFPPYRWDVRAALARAIARTTQKGGR
jgi:hypothetical protein